MIKKIQADTGAKVQFINLNEDTPDDRRCLITGNPDQVTEAKQRIEALVDSALVISSYIFILFLLCSIQMFSIKMPFFRIVGGVVVVVAAAVAIDKAVVTLTEIKVGAIVVKHSL